MKTTAEVKSRPTDSHGSIVTSPSVGETMQMLGAGIRTESIALSQDEFKAIKRLYGFGPEKPTQKPAAPVPPVRADFPKPWEYDKALAAHQEAMKRHQDWQDPLPLLQAGANRNALRHAEADGTRLIAWIARYVPRGEDPLKILVQLARDAGWDVDPTDLEWASEGS